MHTSITKHSLNNDKTLHLNHFRSQLKHPGMIPQETSSYRSPEANQMIIASIKTVNHWTLARLIYQLDNLTQNQLHQYT